ncbi:Poly [ADP-ribose] polymerase-1 [Lachnospiraceae bacterium TWA4]|nr:Poly [ADP-ribose] polymerase-1 [Lachnospiraceae bacterium TWA4]
MNRVPTYLVMVTANNNNKYYRMFPDGDYFNVEFGRVGASCQHTRYDMSQWDKKYKEKIRKGYEDQTELMKDLIQEIKPKTDKKYKDIENQVIKQIVDKLQSMARATIQKNYRVGANEVTQAMVDKAQNQIDDMVSRADKTTKKRFNEDLLQLFMIIPRKMGNVNEYLAKHKSDIGEILTREQDLLDVMKGQVVQHIVLNEEPEETIKLEVPQQTILEAMGLEFEEVTDEEVEHIKKLLGSSKDKFKQAWRVKNWKTEARFNDFVEKEGIKRIKELWHGSRNENWWNIINTGLVLRPTNVVISGKMFGMGTYFAPKAQKSIGYTSLLGSYWARGNEKTAYMAVMKVAYGKPYNVNSFDDKYCNFNYEKLQKEKPGANCLHAHAGDMLRNDEIVIYKEEQCTIEYLVEIG